MFPGHYYLPYTCDSVHTLLLSRLRQPAKEIREIWGYLQEQLALMPRGPLYRAAVPPGLSSGAAPAPRPQPLHPPVVLRPFEWEICLAGRQQRLVGRGSAGRELLGRHPSEGTNPAGDRAATSRPHRVTSSEAAPTPVP